MLLVDRGHVALSKSQVDHRATRYTVRVLHTALGPLVMTDPDNSNRGRWVQLREASIAWTYLAEKLDLREGDREGYVMALADLGVEVF